MSKKVVHVVGNMDIGGVESWLMNILRTSNSKDFHHEFIVLKSKEGYYNEEIIRLGGSIHVCELNRTQPIRFATQLYSIIKNVKPDVIHSHIHAFSGVIVLISWLAGVNKRIAHSHSDKRFTEKNANYFRRFYSKIMRLIILRFATSAIAVSEKAAESLYGENWAKKDKCKIIYCGVDYCRFTKIDKYIDYYNQLQIPSESIVIGHVGRFEEPKNHQFILDIFHELSKKDSRYFLVLVGEGSLKSEIEKASKNTVAYNRIKFLGNRADVPELMVSLFDIFIFPSLWEGLPLTLIEAQFANLTCLVSENITKECNLGLCLYFPITDSEYWARQIQLVNINNNEKSFMSSVFNIKNSNKELFKEYMS